MDELADAWVATAEPPAPAAAAPAPAPAAAPAPAQAAPHVPQAQQVPQGGADPYWQQMPDGSLLARGFAIDWHGEQGNPGTRVVLRSTAGEVHYDGPFADLARGYIENVWVSYAARVHFEQQQGGAPAASAPSGHGGLAGMEGDDGSRSRRRRVFGVGLALLGIASAGFTVWNLLSSGGDDGYSGGSSDPPEEV